MKDNSTIKYVLANVLRADLVRNGQKVSLAEVQRKIENLVDSMSNTAPQVPVDDPPEETDYPDRESLKPTPEDVPDPAETEGTDETKTSTPDYPALKRYRVAIGQLNDSASTLFEMESSSRFDGRFDKNDIRQQTFDYLEEVRSSIYDL